MSENYINDIQAYNGNEPYVFISYAHKDNDRVLPAVALLQQRGYRVWLDLGIEAGTEWSDKIAQRLRECDVVLAFISPSFVASENCLDEVAYAKSNQKPTLLIYLEDNVILPEGTEMQTARFQRMYMSRMRNLDDFADRLIVSGLLDRCKVPAPAAEPVPTPPAAPVTPAAPATKKKPPLGLWIGIGAAVLAAIVLVVVLLSGGSSDMPNGTYNLTSIELYGQTYTAEELAYYGFEDYSITFNSDGTGYTYDGFSYEHFTYTSNMLTVEADGEYQTISYTYEDGTVSCEIDSCYLNFAK